MDPSTQLWFHGLITRETGERLLLQTSNNDGTFLIRESTSKVGSCVLSVVYNRKVVHYQVNKKPNGFVSIEGGSSFHGPVELVEYHKLNKDRLLTKLIKPCNRSDAANVEVYQNITHTDLEEATKVVLHANGINDEVALRQYKGQFQEMIGTILHKEQPWFHGIIPRTEAENRLKTSGLKDGMFLIRERGSPRGTFALVLCYKKQSYHYLFEPNQNKQLSIKAGRLFDNLMGVVSFYSQNCEGLWCPLKEPCDVSRFEFRPKKEYSENVLLNQYIQSALTDVLLRSPPEELQKYRNKVRRAASTDSAGSYMHVSQQKTDLPRRGVPAERGNIPPRPHSIATNDALPPHRRTELPPVPPSNDAWKFEKVYDTAKLRTTLGYANQLKTQDGVSLSLDSKRLKLDSELGHGNFGSVMKGTYNAPNRKKIAVAVKTLKDDDIPNQRDEVLAEAGIMAKLDHPYIIRLIGVTQAPNLMIVMEIAPMGPLNKYLKKHTSMRITNVLILMLQVDEGMNYLERQHFVHRDLAARNVLVVSEDFVKISDFGMSRATGAGNEYYRAERAGKWPLKWYAPECIYYRKFTSKGDVWSYGVTMWEALTYGRKPFEGLKGPQIVEGIEEGRRLSQPDGCPTEIYTMMHSCWEYNPDHRPTFANIGSTLCQYLAKKNDVIDEEENGCPVIAI